MRFIDGHYRELRSFVTLTFDIYSEGIFILIDMYVKLNQSESVVYFKCHEVYHHHHIFDYNYL